jgi:protein phosphatase
MTASPGVRVAGSSHVGKVRTTNEDALIVDAARGLHAVLDGMGGAMAGDVASITARDAIAEYIDAHRGEYAPAALLERAIVHASATVFEAAQTARERHGMGTTVVACMVVDPRRIVVAHVGDSRAYLLRNGRLQQITRDHTIVEELVERGMLPPEEAERHPYKNVLSRNLGARPDARVDVNELELKPGDRMLLCSDGLYGYASMESIQYLLGSGDAPEHVARDLIDLALRGGGGDNVSAIVVEAPPAAPTSTQVVRTHGAVAWWQRRDRFAEIAAERGLAENPICSELDPDEALDVVARSLCQAIFHDLEKSTGVNVWTFAQNLAGAWFERDGEWAALRALIDILVASARGVVDDIRASDAALGFLLDVAVSRALVVAELAIGGLLADRLRQIDAEVIRLHVAAHETIEQPEVEDSIPSSASRDSASKFIDQPTIPFLRPDRAVTSSNITADIADAVGNTLELARARCGPRGEIVRKILGALETIANDNAGQFASAVVAARELFGVRSVDDAGIMPLYDALEQARVLTAASVHLIDAEDLQRARALRAISGAHQRLVGAVTGLVLEAVAPFSERLRDAQVQTATLRADVARSEHKRAELEKRFATTIDQSTPWDKRGETEW